MSWKEEKRTSQKYDRRLWERIKKSDRESKMKERDQRVEMDMRDALRSLIESVKNDFLNIRLFWNVL